MGFKSEIAHNRIPQDDQNGSRNVWPYDLGDSHTAAKVHGTFGSQAMSGARQEV